MKALTIWQPWASLIAAGHKPFEFRKWTAPKSVVGKRIAIHAAAREVHRADVARLLRAIENDERLRVGLFESAWHFLRDVSAKPYSLPRSTVVCTAVVGTPTLSVQEIAARLDCPMPDDLAEPSGRVPRARNWAWPLFEVEAVTDAGHVRGAQGLWNWTPDDGFLTVPRHLRRQAD